ncbi:hypothetical protein FSP39_004310 [Pinctada imbricata]|uniref:Ig-like domain-containing protein n=1 Tax=Pinctada imbricata TaxID=66713 RepID=A0AA88XTD9_PINIB|nr:hypothetical protein FSP39_004310 [Pinctada imbricata]
MVETPPEFNYKNLEPHGITGEGRTELMFTVEACKDARVALYPYDPVIDGDTMYEVVFGGSHNTRHTIRTRRADNNYLVNMTTIANLLSCTEYRSFWISWKNFYIIGGTGLTVGIDKVVEYNDTRPSPYIVRYIGISTWRNHAGKWIFSDEVPRFLSVSPSSVYATKGDSVVLHCKSIGIPLPVITWQKDGVNISGDQIKYNTSIIGYLTIHNFQSTDSGLYRCIATNSEGDNSHDVRVDCRGKFVLILP